MYATSLPPEEKSIRSDLAYFLIEIFSVEDSLIKPPNIL
jgi:hypothetical protein